MENSGFHSIEKTTLSRSVVDQICNAIATGRYNAGDQIPTEPELAKMLGCGRNTVREAIKILVAYGILEIRRAEGTFVCKGISKAIISPMVYHWILSAGSSHNDMIEFQVTIDKAATSLCCSKYTDEDFREITAAYDALMTALHREQPDLDEIYRHDEAFHFAIAKATHNPFMEITYTSIWEYLKVTIHKEIRMTVEENISRMIRMHEDIYQALRNRDETAAGQASLYGYLYHEK